MFAKKAIAVVVGMGVSAALAAGVCLTVLEAEPNAVVANPEAQAAANRIAVKSEIASCLIRGEITLLAAANKYRELDDGNTMSTDVWRSYYPTGMEAELYCHQVIAYVSAATQSFDDNAHVNQFNAELARRLERGTCSLPDLATGSAASTAAGLPGL